MSELPELQQTDYHILNLPGTGGAFFSLLACFVSEIFDGQLKIENGNVLVKKSEGEYLPYNMVVGTSGGALLTYIILNSENNIEFAQNLKDLFGEGGIHDWGDILSSLFHNIWRQSPSLPLGGRPTRLEERIRKFIQKREEKELDRRSNLEDQEREAHTTTEYKIVVNINGVPALLDLRSISTEFLPSVLAGCIAASQIGIKPIGRKGLFFCDPATAINPYGNGLASFRAILDYVRVTQQDKNVVLHLLESNLETFKNMRRIFHSSDPNLLSRLFLPFLVFFNLGGSKKNLCEYKLIYLASLTNHGINIGTNEQEKKHSGINLQAVFATIFKAIFLNQYHRLVALLNAKKILEKIY